MFRNSLALAVVVCGICSCQDSKHPAKVDASHAGAAGSAADSPDAGMDAAAPDSGATSWMPPDTATCSGDPPVMKVLDTKMGVAVDPDWSCASESVSMSTTQDSQTLQFKLISLTPGDTAGVTVDFFLGASTLGKPYVTRMFDGASDHVSLDVPSAQASLSIKVNALKRDDPMRTLAELREYELPIRSFTEPLQGFMLLAAQRALIVNLTERGMADDDTSQAFLISYARDCSGHDVRGAQFELVDDETGVAVESATGTGLPHQTYLQFALPNPDCTFTSYDQAAWVMINAPANTNDTGVAHAYRLRVKGRMHESDKEPVLFGETQVEMVPGAITYANLNPHVP